MKRIVCIFLIVSMIFTINTVSYADSVNGLVVPDFESYCIAANISLDKHPYYFIFAYASGGYLNYCCYFTSSNIVYNQNADNSGGSWSTSFYSGYTTLTDFVKVVVKCDFNSNYMSHSISTDEKVGSKHFYIDVNAKNLYSNHNIMMINTDKSVSTFSAKQPFLIGSEGNYWYNHTSPLLSNSSDETNNKLSSIVDWLSDIGSWLTSGFSNVVNSIIELPSKFWTILKSGLIELFVPDEIFIKNTKSNWVTLLSSRFGAVYESFNFLIDFVSGFKEQTAVQTVTFPQISVPLSGEEFVFGGYEVILIPEGFQSIVDILKGLISLVCTIAFVNTMKNKLSLLLGGHEDDN